MRSSDYYMDLAQFSLEKLKDLFKNTKMLPSQQVLKDDIDERFACLERQGIVGGRVWGLCTFGFCYMASLSQQPV